MEISIIEANSSHTKPLCKIIQETFADTYSSYANTDQMNSYVKKHFDEKYVDSLLNDTDVYLYCALERQNILGYSILRFNERCPYLIGETHAKFEKNYVLKGHQGKGIGRSLYLKRLEVLNHKKCHQAFLRVSHTNKSAIKYHQRNGFRRVGEKVEDILDFGHSRYQDFDIYMAQTF